MVLLYLDLQNSPLHIEKAICDVSCNLCTWVNTSFIIHSSRHSPGGAQQLNFLKARPEPRMKIVL